MSSERNGRGLEFDAYIAEHTRQFSGRLWVFEQIHAWLAQPSASRYLLLTDERLFLLTGGAADTDYLEGLHP